MVETLRTSRLALLFGDAGADKTAFLNAAVLPLLQRRATDVAEPATARRTGVVVPFSDRRKRSSGQVGHRKVEKVVVLDDWSKPPLPALKSLIRHAASGSPAASDGPPLRLADTLTVLGERLDAKFIVLLDRVEELLLCARGDDDVAAFIDELAEAINQPWVPASFLIAVDESARPGLADLRSRIPRFYDFSLRLSRLAVAGLADAPAESVGATGAWPPAVAPEPGMPVPMLLTDVVADPVPEVLPEVRSDVAAGAPQVLPTESASPAPTEPAATPVKRSSRRPKVKQPRPPVVPVSTEDVYALIQSTLSRIEADTVDEPCAVPTSAQTAAAANTIATAADRASASAAAATPADRPTQSSAAVMRSERARVDQVRTDMAALSAAVRRRARPATLRSRWKQAVGWLVRRLRRVSRAD